MGKVKTYLRRVFSDPYITGGGAVKRWFLRHIIPHMATGETQARYASIGGKSTALEDAQQLARQVTETFATRNVTVQCSVATRYDTPDIEGGLMMLAGSGNPPVTPVYLFPHETSTMTGSCADVLGQASARLGIAVASGVRHLGNTTSYARGWADAIKAAVREPRDTFVLLSCHSLPLAIVERGDPYVSEVERSIGLIKSRLEGLACGLAYQSRRGKKWLGPTAEAAAADAYEQGFRELIVVPLSFVSESTETLVDLDRELRDSALALGFRRMERLGTPDRLGFLCSMVVEGLCEEWGLEQQ
ncbi:MAG: ferrochelatase [Phycisphaerae bacterium]|nr:ferrochelatase [Phycisphaerae bacterium]